MEKVAVASPRVAVGDEVLYHSGRWRSAEVLEVGADGGVLLSYRVGDDVLMRHAKHGKHVGGWLTYDEAAHSVR